MEIFTYNTNFDQMVHFFPGRSKIVMEIINSINIT